MSGENDSFQGVIPNRAVLFVVAFLPVGTQSYANGAARCARPPQACLPNGGENFLAHPAQSSAVRISDKWAPRRAFGTVPTMRPNADETLPTDTANVASGQFGSDWKTWLVGCRCQRDAAWVWASKRRPRCCAESATDSCHTVTNRVNFPLPANPKVGGQGGGRMRSAGLRLGLTKWCCEKCVRLTFASLRKSLSLGEVFSLFSVCVCVLYFYPVLLRHFLAAVFL